MSRLKEIVKQFKIKQRHLCDALGLSESSVSAIINHDEWPKKRNRTDMISVIEKHLLQVGVPIDIMNELPWRVTEPADTGEEEGFMLLRRQGLFPQTKRHFKLASDPFGEVQDREDMFLSDDIRYVREALFHTARHGGFVAVVGESGSGKSTLRRDLIDRLDRDKSRVHIIEPYVIGMEDNDVIGKSLKAAHISEAIMSEVAPGEILSSSSEARFRQVHKVLKASSQAGYSHCLIIEEAHSLPIPTIKHLKRFLELEQGFKKLLSIVLLGQTELAHKLSETNYAVREVVQRCELVMLRAMNGELPEYIKFRFGRIGRDAHEIITAEAVDALRDRLTGPKQKNGQQMSLVYPLAVENMLKAAMNLAADIGSPMVTPDIISQV